MSESSSCGLREGKGDLSGFAVRYAYIFLFNLMQSTCTVSPSLPSAFCTLNSWIPFSVYSFKTFWRLSFLASFYN